MFPGMNLSMQHLPNVDHVDAMPNFNEPNRAIDPQQQQSQQQTPQPVTGGGPMGLHESARKSVQDVFVVDLRKINGTFGISLTVRTVGIKITFDYLLR